MKLKNMTNIQLLDILDTYFSFVYQDQVTPFGVGGTTVSTKALAKFTYVRYMLNVHDHVIRNSVHALVEGYQINDVLSITDLNEFFDIMPNPVTTRQCPGIRHAMGKNPSLESQVVESFNNPAFLSFFSVNGMADDIDPPRVIGRILYDAIFFYSLHNLSESLAIDFIEDSFLAAYLLNA